QAEDGIRDRNVTGVQTCALPIFPIRYANGAMVYVRDVGFVHDGFSPQTNLVRRDGRHSALLPILSNGSASTLTVVGQARALMPRSEERRVGKEGRWVWWGVWCRR